MDNLQRTPAATTKGSVRLSVPATIFLKEARRVAFLARKHLARLRAADRKIDPGLPERMLALCATCRSEPWRRSTVPIPASKVVSARSAFRHLVKLLERAAKSSSALSRDLATAQQAHPRPRGAEGTLAALGTALVLARRHRSLFVDSAGELEGRIHTAQSRHEALDEVMNVRRASVRERSTTVSPRAASLATLQIHVRTIRSAASVAFAQTDPKLYRKFTSAYEREVKRAYRKRTKAEPVPTKALTSGTTAKARRPRTRRVELVQRAAAARRDRSSTATKCG